MNFKNYLIMMNALLIAIGLQGAENTGKYSGMIKASSYDLHAQAENAVESDDFDYVKSLIKAGVRIQGDGTRLVSLLDLEQSDAMRKLLKSYESWTLVQKK